MLLGEQLRRSHQRHLEPILERHQRRDDGHDRLAGADVPLQQPVHRTRPPHVGNDGGQRFSLARSQSEWQRPAGSLPDAVVDLNREALPGSRPAPPVEREAGLEQEELLDDQPDLRGRAEPGQLIDRRPVRREVRLLERHASSGQSEPFEQSVGQRILEPVGKAHQRVVGEPPLHPRRHAADTLVDRDNPTGVD